MKAEWLISNLGKDSHIQELHYAVQETGRKSRIVSLGDIAELAETESNESKCVIACGSIWGNKEIRRARPNWIGTFHEKPFFSCSNYYSHLGKYITQKNYCMLTLAEMIRRRDWVYEKFGKDDQVFIRPDSGEKEFNGEIVHKGKFKEWEEYVNRTIALDPTLLCVVSEPVDIQGEMRIVVADGKAVTGSFYRIAKHISYEEIGDPEWDEAAEFAELVLADLPPNAPPFFVVDIAVEYDRLSVLEIGCFCCAGIYHCNRHEIAEAVSNSAEKFFKEKTRNDLQAKEHCPQASEEAGKNP